MNSKPSGIKKLEIIELKKKKIENRIIELKKEIENNKSNLLLKQKYERKEGVLKILNQSDESKNHTN